MNHGRTIFAQVVELLPRKAFDLAVARYDGQNHVRSFSCMDQLLCMIFAQLTCRSSLRETVLCLQAMGPRRYHCGIRGNVAKSKGNRNWVFHDINAGKEHVLFRMSSVPIVRHVKMRQNANPFDPQWWDYFEARRQTTAANAPRNIQRVIVPGVANATPS